MSTTRYAAPTASPSGHRNGRWLLVPEASLADERTVFTLAILRSAPNALLIQPCWTTFDPPDSISGEPEW